jgi:hypothetical protein
MRYSVSKPHYYIAVGYLAFFSCNLCFIPVAEAQLLAKTGRHVSS